MTFSPERGVIDKEKRENWLTQFNFSEKNRKDIHCSGHMRQTNLEEMIKTIHPKKVFPFHTTNADEFNKMGLNALGIEVILPEKGKIYSF